MKKILVLDTNVMSEMTRSVPDPTVAAWYLHQDSASLYTTAITKAEIFYGVELLPKGRRKQRLSEFARVGFEVELAGRILAFDEASAVHYAAIRGRKRSLGLTMSALDTQIAAIVMAHDAALVTRNTNDFKECGIDVINPWTGKESIP